MELQEASDILRQLSQWIFVREGLIEVGEVENVVDLKKYTLQQLLAANNVVERENKRKIEIGGKQSIQTVIADRSIAALYVCLHYPPSKHIVACVGNVGCCSVAITHEPQ